MFRLRDSVVSLSAISLIITSLTYSHFAFSNESPKVDNLTIPHTKQSIEIDGELNDQAWEQALSVNLNIVNNPWNNKPSPVKTEAKVIENGEYLYIAFLADDPNPEKIIGFLGDRDTKWGDDIVGIKLDTFNSRRLTYEFFVNPFGVQNDSISNEVTGDVNDLWDGIWYSYGKKTSKGFQVEIAIPFHILNFEQGDHEKTWAMELIRLYPRDERLRISHMEINRDNNCWVCQMPEARGFKDAQIGKNLTLTPYAIANRNDNRDIYNRDSDWNSDNNFDAGLDVRWGITPNTSLTATLNPDFSTVESDAGQLSVNTTYSLYYDEKRRFFLENSDYFNSNYNLIYTRNIAEPNYGVKLTGRQKNHAYGVFITDDEQTNFIVPGNTGSRLVSLNQKSKNLAANYRYNVNDNFSIGTTSTIRESDDYYNILGAVDVKYRFDNSNSVLAQVLYSDTKQGSEFTGQAYKIDFVHESEKWRFNAAHQELSDDFRADLGFMTKADFKEHKLSLSRIFYGEPNDFLSEYSFFTRWNNQLSIENEFIEKTLQVGANFYGPMLSFVEVSYKSADKIGLRYDNSMTQLTGNTSRFDENQLDIYIRFQPLVRFDLSFGTVLGDKIDYGNDRLGDYRELYTYGTYYVTDHLAFDIYLRNQQLDTNEGYVFKANLVDVRISYQFDVWSYLKLNMVYSDVDRNPLNNPNSFYSQKDRSLSTQLIYSYQLNPQTVFFLGYSDSSYQDDDLTKLRREQRTFFTKISYAWMP